MKYEIIDSPDFAMVQFVLNRGEKIVAESGAMLAQDTGLSLATSMRGGLLSAAKRKLLGGESIFQNTFTADSDGQRLYLAAAAEGDLQARELAAGEEFFLQSGAYVAHSGEELILDTKFAGARGFFGGLGFFLLKVVGPGTVFYGSYGALHQVDLDTENYTIDTGHIVAFTEGLEYRVRPFGGMKGLFFSGEGLVADFSGQGSVWLQTRNPSSLASFVHPFRRVQQRSE